MEDRIFQNHDLVTFFFFLWFKEKPETQMNGKLTIMGDVHSAITQMLINPRFMSGT